MKPNDTVYLLKKDGSAVIESLPTDGDETEVYSLFEEAKAVYDTAGGDLAITIKEKVGASTDEMRDNAKSIAETLAASLANITPALTL